MGSTTRVPVERATLTLFVAGRGEQSQASILCARQLAGLFDDLALRVIDIVEDPAAAEAGLVLVVPSLVLGRPGQRDQIVAGALPSAVELAGHFGLVAPAQPVAPSEREHAISRIWESNPDGMLVIDAEGTVCFLNEACETLLGRPAAELIGTPLDFHLAPDGPTELEIPREGQSSTVELRTAQTVWDGRPAVMATLRDVTERKHLLDELLRTRAELTRSNEDLERFAAIVAHDLKTPLVVIKGAADMLGEVHRGVSKVDGKDFIDMIMRSVTRMTLLLDAVLDAAHAGADLDLQPTDLGPLVREVATTLHEQIVAAGATVELGPLPTVLVDPTQMTAVFQNLLANAIKYRSSQRALHVEVSSEEADGGVVITMSDNGIGIDAGDRERVFTMLDRLPSGRRQAEGHGIGLSVCKRVVERHGGRIWVDGQAEGTSFRFFLPGPGA